MKAQTLVFLFAVSGALTAQHSQQYFPEDDTLVVQKLEKWQDLKFGLLMHWGPYSQRGIVESWSICPEDYGWCERKKGINPGIIYIDLPEFVLQKYYTVLAVQLDGKISLL